MRNVNDMERLNDHGSRAQALFNGGWEIQAGNLTETVREALEQSFGHVWKLAGLSVVAEGETVSFSAKLDRDRVGDALDIVGIATLHHSVCNEGGLVELHSYLQVYWDRA